VFGNRGDVFGGRGDIFDSFRRSNFAGFALGVTFLEFGHVQVVARYLEVPLAHVKARRGFGKVQVFSRAVPIPPRPYPKSKLAHRFATWHVATHKMQHERILTVARRTAHGSRALQALAYTAIRSSERKA
jgi:hypothetical protein